MNERIAKFYQQKPASKTGFEKVSFDAGQRAGIVTHPYMLSMLSYSAESSPIHRGVFLARSLLGVTLKPPPEAAAHEQDSEGPADAATLRRSEARRPHRPRRRPARARSRDLAPLSQGCGLTGVVIPNSAG